MDTASVNVPKGILHQKTGESKFTLSRFQPSADTGFFVRHYWVVKWDLRGQEPYRQTVLAHPNVNLVFEQGGSRVYGVAESASNQLLEDQGWAVGVMFRPGGFYPFWRELVSRITGGSVSFREVFGMDSGPLETDIAAQADEEGMANRVESFFAERLPERDHNVELVSDMVNRMRDDRTILRVDDVVSQTGIHKRTIQRLFDRYVGVSPKRVIRHYRLHEAAQRLEQGLVRDWSELSLELGYYDQSHFIRDFKAVVGPSPLEYAREVE